jgi:hypothetical protein
VPIVANDVSRIALPFPSDAVPRRLPSAEKETEPLGFVPKTDAVNLIGSPGIAVTGNACSAVVLVMGAGLTGTGLAWFNNASS